RRVAIALCGATALAGLIWLVAGIALPKNGEPWIALGILVAFFAGIFALAFRFEGADPQIPNWRRSGLVISPVGLAMIQGDMRGELRWAELRDIRFGAKPGFLSFEFSSATPRGIQLVVEGATIIIANIYDRPLALIHERLRDYWQEGDD